MPNDSYSQIARNLLSKLLSAGPMKGATLKLRMLREFEDRAGVPFDAAFRGFPKFSSFLAANADLVEVTRPAVGSPGDIAVRLLVTQTQSPAQVLRSVESEKLQATYLPNPIWLAFTNPDPRRRRRFNRRTLQIEHHLEGELRSDEGGAEWVEIKPIPAGEQLEWMRRFVNSETLPAAISERLLPILDQPYSSASLYLFRLAAGEHGDAWRRFRTDNVMAAVKDWCNQNGVPFSDVSRQVIKATPAPRSQATSLRHILTEAVRTASEDELKLILVPASLLALVAHSSGR